MIFVIILLTALINIALGVVSYNKNPKSDTHRLLTLLTVIFAAWTVTNYYSLNSSTSSETLFWIRAVMFVTAPLGPVLYLFIKAFPHTKLVINKLFFKAIIFLTLFVQAIAFTPYIFSSVTITDQITPTPEFGIYLFALLFVGLPILGFIELIKKYRIYSGIEKLQLKYLIIGIISSFLLLILTNFIAVVVFSFSGLVLFGPIFSLILVGLIVYSIIKHRLLEVNVLLARSIVYALLIIIVAVFYTVAVFMTSLYFFGELVSVSEAVTRMILALFVAFTLVPIRNYLENVTDQIFFKGKFDPNTLVFQLTKITASTINLEDLMKKTLQKLTRTLRVTYGSFVIYTSQQKFIVFSRGQNIDVNYKKTIAALYSLKRMIIFDEEKSGRTKDFMRSLDAGVIVPLLERGEKMGMLILGEKKNGQIYSSQALRVLEIFAPVIAVAIRNSKSYEEIKNFNITLKREIQSATRNLKSANEKLKELGRQKDEFMAIASHELKTPVTSVKLYTQILLNQFRRNGDAKSVDAIEKMNSQLNKLVVLMNDLLDVTKIEAGKLRFDLEVFDLNKLVVETVEDMQRISKHKINLEINDDCQVYANRERIEQVLINFITNAVKYSPKANKVIVSIKREDKNAIVGVQDFGMGLTPKEQSIVFERYNRAGQEGSGGMPGLGLGLYISREIIVRHKGKIWVESKKKKGSTFYFSLPLKSS